MSVLVDGDDPLVVGEVSTPSDLVLIVTPEAEEAAEATASADISATNANWVSTLTAIGSFTPTVVAGYAESSADLVPQVRTAGGVATVDQVGELVGQVTVPLALAAAAADLSPAGYGFGIGSTAVIPPAVTLLPPTWMIPVAPDPTATEEAA